jgi:hypothetical protein
MVDLVRALGEGRPPEPSFADGLQVQRVMAAVERSASRGSAWETVTAGGVPAPAEALDTRKKAGLAAR